MTPPDRTEEEQARLDREFAILVACGFEPEELYEIEMEPEKGVGVWRMILPEKTLRKWP